MFYLIWFPIYDNKDDPHATWILAEILAKSFTFILLTCHLETKHRDSKIKSVF